MPRGTPIAELRLATILEVYTATTDGVALSNTFAYDTTGISRIALIALASESTTSASLLVAFTQTQNKKKNENMLNLMVDRLFIYNLHYSKFQ